MRNKNFVGFFSLRLKNDRKTNHVTSMDNLYSGAYMYDIITNSTKILLIITKKKCYASAKPYIRHGVIVHMPNSECLVPHISCNS